MFFVYSFIHVGLCPKFQFYFKPVKRFKHKSGVSEFRSTDDSASKGVLDLLETIYLRLGKIVI